MTFNNILEKYRKIAFSKEDLDSRFERLMQAYLKTDPKDILCKGKRLKEFELRIHDINVGKFTPQIGLFNFRVFLNALLRTRIKRLRYIN